MKDNLGVLLGVSSLPSRHGIGDFGKEAYTFIDWCKSNNYAYWQILPLNPLGPGFSPYQSTSSNALEYRYISLDFLSKEGLLKRVPSLDKGNDSVNFEKVGEFKKKYLWIAYKNFFLKKSNIKKLNVWRKENPWVDVYATFETFRMLNNEQTWTSWTKYEQDYYLKHKNPPRKYKHLVDYVAFVQYVAHKQWLDILAYARKVGVKLIADMPFYVGFDSTDVWLHRDLFKIDNTNKQELEAGVPPDAFSDLGQLWGNPIYDYDKLKERDYDIMVDRVGFLANMCDYLRLDHFRAFDTYYVIPAGSPDAINGEWRVGPRHDFFNALYKKYPNINLIAEDLGELFPSVLELRDELNLPGMYIVQFNMLDMNKNSNDRLIVYTGTHDNETLLGWIKSLRRDQVDFLKWRLNCHDEWYLFDMVFNYSVNLPSYMTIVPMQDLLKLDNHARMNTPGTLGYPNWAWKLPNWDIFKLITYRNI